MPKNSPDDGRSLLPPEHELRVKRLLLMLSVQDMADKTGLSPKTIKTAESGRPILASSLAKILKVLNAKEDLDSANR